jgi:serine/threonine protein kinase
MATKVHRITGGAVAKPGPLFLHETHHHKSSTTSKPETGEKGSGYILSYSVPFLNTRFQHSLTQSERLEFFYKTCLKVKALHDAGFCHGDLKLENIGEDTDGNIILFDTGNTLPAAVNEQSQSETIDTSLFTVTLARNLFVPSTYGGTYPSEFAREVRRHNRVPASIQPTYFGREDIYALAQIGCFVCGTETVYEFCVRHNTDPENFNFHLPDRNPHSRNFPKYRDKQHTFKMPEHDRLHPDIQEGTHYLIDVILTNPMLTIDDVIAHPIFDTFRTPEQPQASI